jgi:hypothetical protein
VQRAWTRPAAAATRRATRTLRANGERMIEVGNMKQREALALLTRAAANFPPQP